MRPPQTQIHPLCSVAFQSREKTLIVNHLQPVSTICAKRFFNLRQTKNHSAEIEKSFGAEKYIQMQPFLIHYQTIS